MRLSMALSAALAALVLGGAALLGPVPAAVAACLVIAVIAFGWPRQMGAPARLSLTLTMLVAGVLGVFVMALWPRGDAGPRGAWALFEPLAVVLAFGTMASFIVQLVRGTGRPLRLESTVTTMGGVLVCLLTASWVPLAQHREAPGATGLVVTLAATLIVTSLIGLTPFMQGRPRVLALVMVPASGVVAALVSLLLGAPAHTAWVHAAAALGTAGLVSLTAAAAPSSRPLPEDRVVGTTLSPRRAGYALAMAPVGAAGVVGHVMLCFLA